MISQYRHLFILLTLLTICSNSDAFPSVKHCNLTEHQTSNQSKIVTVTKVEAHSDWFLIESSSGLALVEWFGGVLPFADQKFYGDVDKFGFVELTSKVGAKKMKVWVDDYMLSNQKANKKLAEKVKKKP